MAIGKRLLVFSEKDPRATELVNLTQDWGCLVTPCESEEDLRGKVEGSDHDWVFVDGIQGLRRMIGEGDSEGGLLELPLAEVEKRHILRILASTGGNKTRAAKILGIDTKTLYNKLKSYGAAADARRRRQASNGAITA